MITFEFIGDICAYILFTCNATDHDKGVQNVQSIFSLTNKRGAMLYPTPIIINIFVVWPISFMELIIKNADFSQTPVIFRFKSRYLVQT